ncbi:UNVERIFIED_CONTAM: hypothetical protein Scaly_1055600 [Sesamum calycinum]|uniref:Pentatricopeptide repeat-containing protein n=1 Tax=Sesamum calycinum TaxID=2727403 RepID=A0AAW2QKC2_9LAMI
MKNHCRLGEINASDARFYFNKLIHMQPSPPTDTSNHILGSISRNGLYTEVFLLYRKKGVLDIPPDSLSGQKTYGILINGLCKAQKVSLAIELLPGMLKSKCEANSISQEAVAYCSLINGFCQMGKVEAREFFSLMIQSGKEPDLATYNSVIYALCLADCLADAEDLFNSMRDKVNIEIAKKLFDQMQPSGLSPSASVHTVLLDGLCKNGHIEEALQLYSSAERNGLHQGFLQKDDADNAIRLLKDMRNRNLMPNEAVALMILHLVVRDAKFKAALESLLCLPILQIFSGNEMVLVHMLRLLICCTYSVAIPIGVVTAIAAPASTIVNFEWQWSSCWSCSDVEMVILFTRGLSYFMANPSDF